MLKNYRHIIAGAVVILFSVVLFIGSFFVEGAKPAGVGTDFMPRLVAICIFALGVANLVSEVGKYRFLKANGKLEPPSEKKSFKEWFYANLDWASAALMVCYTFAIMKIGFLIPSVIYMFLQILLYTTSKKRNWILYVVMSVVIPLGIYLLFRNYFHLMLPAGALL